MKKKRDIVIALWKNEAGKVEVRVYRYGFNGKEKDEDGEWGSLTTYDYGFRIYNPSIARFLSVDPLTRSYPMLTSYQFSSNSPIRFIDLDGLETMDPFLQTFWRPMLKQNERNQMTPTELAADKELELKVGLAVSAGVGAIFAGPYALAYAVLYPVTSIEFAAGVASFGIGVLDEGNQVQIPGPFDDAGRVGTKAIKNLFTNSEGEKIVEFFGGKTAQTAGALNIDIVAEKGIRGTIEGFADLAKKEGFSGSVDKIVANNPQATFLKEASELLKEGGTIL